MRLSPLAALAAILITPACIQEADRDRFEESDDGSSDGSSDNDNNGGDDRDNEDGSSDCAPAPSGTGSWENNSWDGLHCNYLRNGTDDWAYYPNSSETGCIEASWAPTQSCGSVVLWADDNGNRGCDWVIE